VLIIAGSDSGGGAGIQADIKTVTALGGYAATAITAITVQNTLGVSRAEPLAGDLIAAQARAVMEDIGADVIKTGMLGDAEIVELVARLLDDWARPAVIDPVMVAKAARACSRRRRSARCESCWYPARRCSRPMHRRPRRSPAWLSRPPTTCGAPERPCWRRGPRPS
jgi:hydroxymethylpyrimidine kinase/phosphomethylpyrimidine kinase